MLLASFDPQSARVPQFVALPAYAEPLDPSKVDRVGQALQTACYRELRMIDVYVRGRTIVLRGHVCSYHMKQMAQAIALKIMGCGLLSNELTVSLECRAAAVVRHSPHAPLEGRIDIATPERTKA